MEGSEIDKLDDSDIGVARDGINKTDGVDARSAQWR
jgi:hypothetical protein